MKPVEPLYLVELFPLLSRELLAVLKTLQPDDWARPTICLPWSVKDVAAHLLGGNLGRLWKRDETAIPSELPHLDYRHLLNLINQENELWVQAAQKISPEILIEFLELTDRRLYDHFKSLAPDELAKITVAWVSDRLSPNWLDVAREYTEKWLHQQHIREAVNRPLLTGREWLLPVFETFMRGLPHTFQDVKSEDGTKVSISILGAAGGNWVLLKEMGQWQLYVGDDLQAASYVQINQDLAWRLFTKGVSQDDARKQVQIDGDNALGEKVLGMVSIMA